MPEPTIYFTREEFAERQARVRAALAEQGLEGMLLFKIEDMYWLCGLDTQGLRHLSRHVHWCECRAYTHHPGPRTFQASRIRRSAKTFTYGWTASRTRHSMRLGKCWSDSI